MVKWQDFAPASTSREREEIEWSITYSYNATQNGRPRVLLIGDSICNGYNGKVRELLDGDVNVSFWASSKCVTDPDYFRELDFMLDAYPYDAVCFNNGLHSLSTDRAEWDAAYRAAVEFIQAKLPQTKLSLTLSTPLKDAALTAVSASLNETVLALAEEKNLPVIDLFAAMDGLDREEFWSDTYHFRAPAIEMQAKLISAHVRKQLGPEE
ncbi:MAG: SGNH/GDSL hydrolase family protein [Clostridia bacterium]|nr:SGNH/GDSL hydrolase family protein [Clostridia bacterium]